MAERLVFCHDVSPGSDDPCCDSCHEDEEYDAVYSMWMDDHVHLCCAQMRKLERLGIDLGDTKALLAYVDSIAAR